MSQQGCLSNYVGDVLVVYPQARRINEEVARGIHLELKELIAHVKHRKVIVNFENVEFAMDCVREEAEREGLDLIPANCAMVRESAERRTSTQSGGTGERP